MGIWGHMGTVLGLFGIVKPDKALYDYTGPYKTI